MSDLEITGPPNEEDITDKGKGKAVEEEESNSSSDEDNAPAIELEEVEEVEDDLATIDTSNIIGRRTRGKQIDFAKANAELPADEGDEDDDDYIIKRDSGARHTDPASDVDMDG